MQYVTQVKLQPGEVEALLKEALERRYNAKVASVKIVCDYSEFEYALAQLPCQLVPLDAPQDELPATEAVFAVGEVR